jgi:hypothetical protein
MIRGLTRVNNRLPTLNTSTTSRVT